MAYSPEYYKAYWAKNRDRRLASKKIWAQNNREKIRAAYKRRKERLKQNPDPEVLLRIRGYSRKYEINNPEKVLLRAARGRARRDGLEFNIDISDIVIPKVCPILEMPLAPREGGHGPKDTSPSLDRIDNKRGYVKGNVWVISWLANKMKATATPEQLEVFCKNVPKLLCGK